MNNSFKKPTVIVFDVNETLLDMTDVKKKVNNALGSKRGFKLWFTQLLQYSLVDTVTGNYHNFGDIAGATLEMTALALETDLKKDDKKEIVAAMKSLPPYDDVKEGLQLLKDAGFRLVTVTNSAKDTLHQQLKHAGLANYFETTLSVDEFKLYKPHTEVYQKVLSQLGVSPQESLMVAAHGWDIAGALASGMQAAFIERKGQSLYSLSPKPQYTGKDLVEVAKAIIEKENLSNE
jgi:2-haloacid dehalogenase